ncbi:hypothetical protein [Acidithiobacillus thiooxidans]|jgi:hypothetical protein|uniref:Uncharacterized protein n=1 Tax=Acidithiobacillus thiooxidans ATCC 19377 TaxID=637390 RepID=A0A5P9XR26_ACITH|nr:hypothetical protein [Acidithiobacillus thiooxidans]QFX96238.1 hypothetical protein GCD22_01974 [Acidithiobacillus thiooxidans ATCC 19377]
MPLPLPGKSAERSEWLAAYEAHYQHYLSMVHPDRMGIAWSHSMVESSLGPHWWHLFGPHERTLSGWKHLQSTAKSHRSE